MYDLAGRLVAEPATDVSYDAGIQTLTIDGKTSTGGRLRLIARDEHVDVLVDWLTGRVSVAR